MNEEMFRLIDRTEEKCRKWDSEIIFEEFGRIEKDVIPMWIADMDFQSPLCVKQKFQEIINQGTYGYTYVYPEFYEAVSLWQMKRHQVAIKKEWVTLSYGTVSTIHYIIQSFSAVGDNILVNTPVYSPFATASKVNQREVITSPLLNKTKRYDLDFEDLEKKIIEDEPKIYFFCSPHNPSGRIWNKRELTKVAELCLKHQVLLVVDEVHGEHIHQEEFISSLTLEQKYLDNLIVVTSANKAFNLGGLKTSYSMIPNQEIRERLRLHFKKNSVTSPNIFGIASLIAVYQEGDEWLDDITLYIKNNYIYLKKRLNESLPKVKMMELESSYLPWLDFSYLEKSSDELVTWIAKETGVLLESGDHFVSDGQGFLRMNLGTTKELVIEATEAIINLVISEE